MGQIGTLYTFSPNTVIKSSYVNSNYSGIKTAYNAHDTATTGVHGLGSNSIVNNLQVPPIGSIIPFYDFDGAATFNATYWAYCDGSAATLGGGIGAKTLPDLSNRYLVGFGTEGGGDMDTDTWATDAVGNASHQINLQHAHTMTGHIHTMPTHAHSLSSHTHTGPSHTHTGPSHAHKYGYVSSTSPMDFRLYEGDGGGYIRWITPGGSDAGGYTNPHNSSGITGGQNLNTYSAGTGATGSGGTGATGGPSTANTSTVDPGDTNSTTDTMDNQLSATASVQPRSIRVRFIMRIL